MNLAMDVGPADYTHDRLCCPVTVVVPTILDDRLVTVSATWRQPIPATAPHEVGWREALEVTPEPDPDFWCDPRVDAVVAAFRLVLLGAWPEIQETLWQAERDYWWEVALPCTYDDSDEPGMVGA